MQEPHRSERPRSAEERLRSLELFGMRFGLDRMRRMMTALGSPERGFTALHVLGTNGKSSTTRMAAAILEEHGIATAAYTSPHLVSYRERVRVQGREMSPEEFERAIARAGAAADRVNRTLEGDDHVTQFELLTAAAFWHIARSGVRAAVIEAGLGGRYDATSVIDAPVLALTNVGLEHTRWLGPTVRHIAEEKLAALSEGATLALGEALAPEALEPAERMASERSARMLRAEPLPAGIELRARGGFQRHNFALARTSALALLEHLGVEPDERAVARAARRVEVPGRLQLLERDPLIVLDGAHNPHAVRSLAGSLPAAVGARPLALVLGVLEDKDAAEMLRTLLPLVERAYFTAPPSPRALSPAALESLARQLGFGASETVPDPLAALERARAWAAARGAAVLLTGSVYLVGAVLAERNPSCGRQAASLKEGSRA